MSDLTSTLATDEVAGRLVDTVARLLPVHTAVLLHRRDEQTPLSVAAARGTDSTALGCAPDAVDRALLAGPVRGSGGPPQLTVGPGAAAWFAVPLVTRGDRRGWLVVVTGGRAATDAEEQITATLAGQGLAALDNALLFEQITRLAQRDTLTGLYNRRTFGDLAGGRLAADRPTVGIMVDIDHFKSINDTHGHGVGDQVIQTVAQRLSANLRTGDIICRYGGEEFAILLPDTPSEQADAVANRLHAAITGQPVRTDAGDLPVTVSVGLAGPEPITVDGLHELLGHADAALYHAKRSGRNRVSTAAEVPA
jgi:diguanylate cyclase (GGDEF)-like protein